MALDDVAAQARWWAEVLSWQVVYEADDEMVIAPDVAIRQEADHASETQRLLDLGARRVDAGQDEGQVTWAPPRAADAGVR